MEEHILDRAFALHRQNEMTVQWALAAAFLYLEMGILLLFCLPFISPQRWNSLFKSRLIKAIFEYGNFYFNALVLIMALLLADSVREIIKYQKIDTANLDLKNNPQAETMAHMRLFRAQRNLYISGFSLFLLIVLRKVIKLISKQAELEASNEASLKQAKNVSDHCQKVMAENEKLKKAAGDKGKEQVEDEESEDTGNELVKMRSELEEKNEELSRKSKDLEKAQKDLSALKEQAQGITREYDRLLDEHAKVQAQLDKDQGDKKDE